MRYRTHFVGAVALMSAIWASQGLAERVFESSAGPIKVEVVADGLDHPWGMAFLPEGDILLTERSGQLRLIRDGVVGPAIGGLPEVAEIGQGGLLDVALHPGFWENRLVYLSHSAKGRGGSGTVVIRGRLNLDGTGGQLDDVEEIFRMNTFSGGGRHFGSRLAFAPDGTLYITVGDRGEGSRAQDPADHAGSVLRINDDGSIPADNPFADEKGGKAPHIWSIGHRNPQGATIRPDDGSLWIHEHGPRGGDEVNKPKAGMNYGWPRIGYGRHYSGAKIGDGPEAPGLEQPVHFWDPSIAPSGMAFYDGEFFANWKGDLFVGALKFQLLVRLEMDGDTIVGEERLLADQFGRIRDVRSGPDGALWLLTDDDEGMLLRISPQ